MHFSEEIRNYEVMTALPFKDIKTSREYFALGVLKYSFPDQFSNLKKGKAPDLQDMEGSLGVEVTWGGSERDELISGESYKYSHAKTEKDRERCLRIIRQKNNTEDKLPTDMFCLCGECIIELRMILHRFVQIRQRG